MKFVTYLKDGLENIGILKENDVVNLQYIFKSIGEGNPPKTMVELIESSSNDMIHKTRRAVKKLKNVPTILLDEIKLNCTNSISKKKCFFSLGNELCRSCKTK